MLLGKWEEAKGLGEVSILEDRPFDAGDKRLSPRPGLTWRQKVSLSDMLCLPSSVPASSGTRTTCIVPTVRGRRVNSLYKLLSSPSGWTN